MAKTINARQIQVERAYGAHDGNWGDRSIFQGDYVNFGYWQNVLPAQKFTEKDRVLSSAALYAYVINNLNISRSDTVLELGCGRAVGMLDAFMYIDVKKMIGVDITVAQIDRAKIKKDRREKINIQEKLKAENIRQSLDSLEKQWELALLEMRDEKEEFIQEMAGLTKKIEKLQTNKELKDIARKVGLLKNNIKKETDLEKFKQEWVEDLQKNKELVDQTIEEKNEMARKIQATELLVASVDSTGLEDHTIDKIYSVEVFQHIEDFAILAREVNRVLAPEGTVAFCAHLSTSWHSYNKLREENLLLDEIEVLAPVDEVVSAFQENGFNVNHHSIGEHVFEGYEKWVTQIHTSAVVSHNIYESYKSGYIDYYVFIMNRTSEEDSYMNMRLNDKDEF